MPVSSKHIHTHRSIYTPALTDTVLPKISSINSNMAFFWLILAFQRLVLVQSDLINCDDPVIGQHICKVNKTMTNKVIALSPDLFLSGTPLTVSSILTIDSIPEFNENEGTITVNALLFVSWNDTRISIISDDPDW